ncbi:alpha/beta fold hydrolase [Neobacillus dielmonensis]|uniref:alpha/beta fold hydrolase n=1 Tax=Neobacillus dielmonensis TaxID=1347369 RepID=UPI0006937020|nr:alpha/beta fold hydrolase [Neobacillus dielmonensis]
MKKVSTSLVTFVFILSTILPTLLFQAPKANAEEFTNGIVYNDYLEYMVGGDGKYTIGTRNGNPENQLDDLKNLLYGHPSPWSSYTTLNVDGEIMQYMPNVQLPKIDSAQLSNISEQKVESKNVSVQQSLKIVTNSNTNREDMVEIKYSVKNNDSISHDAGLRIMMDTMLGYNDSAPFRVPGVGAVTSEMEFSGDNIPEYWQAFDNLENPSVISQGQLTNTENKPDKVQFTNWGHVYNNPWNYTISPYSGNGDSAVSIYWNPKPLSPGESREYTTYYGLSEFLQDLRPPIALTLTGPKVIELDDSGKYKPNPTTITAYFQNIGNQAANDVELSLLLPSGMKLVDGQVDSQVGTLQPGEIKQVSWEVEIEPQAEETRLDYSVRLAASNAETKTLTQQVKVPASSEAANTVVFIPGIMGTEIWTDPQNGNAAERRWMPVGDLGNILDVRDQTRELAVDGNGKPVNDMDIRGPIDEYYGQMVREMRNAGYNVVEFGYDWRLSNSSNAKKLEELIDGLGVHKVSIVAHSMGGLIASKYLANKQSNADKVDKFITLGTPYYGAPKALYIMETGEVSSWIKNKVIAKVIKEMAPNMKSIYQLFPTKQYFEGNPYYVQVRYDNTFRKNEYKKLSYNKTLQFFKDYRSEWLNEDHFGLAEDFAESLDDNMSRINSVDRYFIVGDQVSTIGVVVPELNETWNRSGYNYAHIDDTKPINGDGTVPVMSANMNKDTDPDKTYYIQEKHDSLASNETVIQQVLNILDDRPARIKGMRKNPKETKKLKLKVECPVDLHVYDQDGNHMGPVSENEVEEDILSGTYYLLDDEKIALLNDGNYQVKMVGTDYGKMTFTMLWYDEENEEEQTIRFDDVPLTPTTIITTTTNREGEIILNLDQNGDNVVDEMIHPTVNLNSAGSQDITAPELSYTVDGEKGMNDWYRSDVRVSMNAEDEGAGIQKIEYQLNNGEAQLYEKPVAIQSEGPTELWMKAYDKNRNYDIQTATVKIDKTKPKIEISGISNEVMVGDSISFNFDAVDDVSGIESVQATLNGQPYTNHEKVNVLQPGENTLEVQAVDKAGNIETKKLSFMVYIPAEVKLDPQSIKKGKNNNAMGTGYLQFVASPYPLETVKLSSITINDVVKPITDSKYGYVKNPIVDYNGDGKKEFMFKFTQHDLAESLPVGNQEVIVKGELSSGIGFIAKTVIRIAQ